MSKILIDALYPQEIRIAKIDKNNKITNFDYESIVKEQLKGNIYLANITRVEPSLQSVFVEYGGGKQGFLPFAEIHPDYYQIPAEDKKKLQHVSYNKEDSESSDRFEKIVSNNEDSDFLDEENTRFEAMKQKFIQSYKIQEVIKKNQVLLVQVTKEERGNKGVSLTTYISLAGRYCVLMPNSGARSGGVSKRIDNVADRKRLREIIKSLNLPQGTSVILRTAALEKNDSEVIDDYKYLVSVWNNIRRDTVNSSAPTLIYQEAGVVKRAIRDLYNSEVTEIIIEGREVVLEGKKLIKAIDPNSIEKIKEHSGKAAIFSHYKIEGEINGFYNNVAPLESGGYLVINITEALVAIDVNSGKATRERSVEETALKTNLQAAKEVARQMQLRDLSGLIVVDFIDMSEVENRKEVEKELRKSFENDKAKVQISRISNLGLIEMSRQRLKPSLMETNMITCPHCNGNGHIKSLEALAVDIFRSLRHESLHARAKAIRVFATADILSYIFNYRSSYISTFESENNLKLFFQIDNNVKSDSFRLELEKELPDEDKEKLSYDKPYSAVSARSDSSSNDEGKSCFVKRIFKKKKVT